MFDRHPNVKVASLELGGDWAIDLVHRMQRAFGKMPKSFGRDPVDSFREHVWVMPFYEDDICALRDAIGIEHIIFGSDWPHPEGLADPKEAASDVAALPLPEQRLALRENLRHLAV